MGENTDWGKKKSKATGFENDLMITIVCDLLYARCVQVIGPRLQCEVSFALNSSHRLHFRVISAVLLAYAHTMHTPVSFSFDLCY